MRSYRGRRLSLLLLSACAVLSLFAASARADLSFQYTFGSSGSGAGQFEEPAGVAVNGSTGDVYIADRQNNRIQQFTEQGDFIRAWGYDVVASGEDDKPFADEVQQVTVPGTSGLFRLTFDGTPSTGPFSSHDESTTGGDGFGDITSGSPTITNLQTVSSRTSLFAGSTQTNFVEPGDGWEVGMPISGPGIPPGTTVTAVYSGFNSDLPDALVLEMSAPVTASGDDITISSS